MRYRLLGPTGLRVSELFLGAMTFGDRDGVGADPAECCRMLDAYAEAGGNVIDTAINYRGGASEEILGELLDGQRDRFVVSTKYTVTRDPSDPNGAGNHRKNLRVSLDTSLRRLRTDHIDVYWVHMWDERTPVEETMRALDDSIRAGKVLYLGISDTPAWVVARANAVAEANGWTPFAAIQVPYSLLQRDIEDELLPMAATLGLSVAAWSPLAGGVLTGKFTGGVSVDAAGPTRVDARSLTEHQHAVAVAVQEVAQEVGATPSQVAIAWTRARSSALHPIVGARSCAQLLDNLGSVDVDLPPEAVDRLDRSTGWTPRFPRSFIQDNTSWVFAAADHQVDSRRAPGR